MRVAFVSCGLERLGIEALSAWVRQAGHEPILVYEPRPLSARVHRKGRIRAHGHLELHIQRRSETGAEPCPPAPQRSRHAAPDPRRGADLGPTKLPLLPLAAESDYPGEWCGWVQVSVTHCPYRSLLVGSSNIVTPLPSQGFRTRRDIPLVDRGREDRPLLPERTP